MDGMGLKAQINSCSHTDLTFIVKGHNAIIKDYAITSMSRVPRGKTIDMPWTFLDRHVHEIFRSAYNREQRSMNILFFYLEDRKSVV